MLRASQKGSRVSWKGEGQPEWPEGQPVGFQGLLEGLLGGTDVQMYRYTDKGNFYSFYKKFFHIGAATQKEKDEGYRMRK